MGYEGPSIYLGAAVGSVLQRRFSRLFSRDDAKVLLVAGAAAGVAAIFKAPLTGMVFALEVPYQEDFARRMLLPAGIAAAVSYVVFVAIYRDHAPVRRCRGRRRSTCVTWAGPLCWAWPAVSPPGCSTSPWSGRNTWRPVCTRRCGPWAPGWSWPAWLSWPRSCTATRLPWAPAMTT